MELQDALIMPSCLIFHLCCIDYDLGFEKIEDGKPVLTTCLMAGERNKRMEEYSVALRYKSDVTEDIVAGCILQGDGKAWFDDLSLTIDGKEIGSLEELSSGEAPALKNTTRSGRRNFFDISSSAHPAVSCIMRTFSKLMYSDLYGFPSNG